MGFRRTSDHDLAQDLGSILKDTMDQRQSEADFTVRMAKISADYQDTLSNVLTFATAVTFVLVDNKPDPSGHLSRLRITAKERNDLIRLIDTAFGKRARSSTEHELPWIDATVTMLRQWLTTSGHVPRP